MHTNTAQGDRDAPRLHCAHEYAGRQGRSEAPLCTRIRRATGTLRGSTEHANTAQGDRDAPRLHCAHEP
jgi:hypothetical protein